MLADERPPSRLCVFELRLSARRRGIRLSKPPRRRSSVLWSQNASEWSNFLSLFEAKALHGLLNVKA